MHKVLINGELITKQEGIKIMDPTTGDVAGIVPALNKKDIDYAFSSAKNAFSSWSEVHLTKRIAYLEKVADLLEKNKEAIAQTLSQEVAKGIKSAISEVTRTVEYIRYTNEEAKRIHPESQTGEGSGAKDKLGIFKRIPVGTVLAISPFNYPLNLAFSKIAPAIVMGNTVVFKAATQGSLTGTWISKVMHDAGIPAGVFNQVSGRGSEIGDTLVSHPDLDMVSFTGGERVGRNLAKKTGMVPLVLELGGKDAALVCDDADLELVASEIIKGGLSYSGQRCTAIKRVIAKSSVIEKLTPLLKEKVSKLTVGSPKEDAFITPLISVSSAEYVQGLVDDATSKGATIVAGGTRVKNMFQPTIVSGVTEEMRLAWEEPFGPVIPLMAVKSIDEAIKIHNKSEFGLQGSVFTKDINKAMSIADKLDTGTVNINRSSSRGPDSFPFIGVKSSGLGVQGVKESLISMSRIKGLVINW